MTIEGIIFDLDGTLVDTIDDIGDSTNILLKRHGFEPYSREDFLRWIGKGAARFIQDAMGEKVPSEQLKSYVEEFKEIYGENLHNMSQLYLGISDLLNALEKKGIKISVLSNKPHHLTKNVVDYYLADWPFDPVFGQREEVPRKPDPAAALEMAGMMDLEPEEILFVGDSQGDLLTAIAAGMVPVGVSWGYGRLGEEHGKGKVKIINRPEELLKEINI